MTRLANQLVLLRDAIRQSSPPDPVTGRMSESLVSELIVADRLPAAPASASEELSWLERFEEEMKALRGPAGDGTEPEDEIDGDALGRYLSQQGHGSVRVRHSQTVSAGMSKKTVLVSIEGSETLPRDIALRVDRSANNYLGTTVTEEFGPLMKIWEGGARVPRPFLLEPTGEVIGDPFIVSEQVAGAPAGSIYFPPPGPNPELLHDVGLLPPDLPRAAIIARIRKLRMAPLLDGFRGAPVMDIEAVADVVQRLGQMVAATPAIREVDLNPVIVYPQGKGALALDALISL